jgi:chitin synthase
VFSWFALANLWLTFSIIIELVPTSVKINIFVTAEVVS